MLCSNYDFGQDILIYGSGISISLGIPYEILCDDVFLFFTGIFLVSILMHLSSLIVLVIPFVVIHKRIPCLAASIGGRGEASKATS